ncbi:MAG TPA: TlpA disulfide reductase family protein [Nocardioides sp.]|nr:TlpA disulfide reductase family protein [Nocardioides sp.]
MRRTPALVACLAAGLALSGCSGLGSSGNGYLDGEGVSVTTIAPDKRDAPVAISGTTLQGAPLDLSSFRGKVTVVNVWWSGCLPCRKEMPMLAQVEKSYATGSDKGKVAFVGIDIRDAVPSQARTFEQASGVSYPSLYDPASKTLLAFGDYDPPAVPSTLVLDQQGRVAALIPGTIPSATTLTNLVDDELGSGS